MSMNVSNRKCIRHIAFRHMKSTKSRNIIAIIAIALTTVLFTALFTIMMSIIYGSEQSSFRQIGSYSHGNFKNMTKEQYEELREDPLISEWGVRRFLGMPTEAPFNKYHVEISCMDENYAKWTFLKPESGHLPAKGTKEAATDTAILSLLGIEPEIGTKFTLSFPVDGKATTQEFTLCGYWEFDEVSPAHHILISESCIDEILTGLNTQCLDGITGLYTLNVMFKNSSDIEDSLLTILERHGYQANDSEKEDNYINIGVNWGYLSSRVDNSMDFGTILSIVSILLLIISTGYLIIYNIFQISVSGDIRFYGLLKTIGTTGRQLKRIILIQALSLSVIGIPLGELVGYGIGAILTPVVLSTLSVSNGTLSISPWIFIGSALFSLITVFISCKKPGRIAAKVSPIEAIRYTDAADTEIKKKKKRNTTSGASVCRMAWANLGRNRKKTIITVLSLSLSVILLNITFASSKSFDLHKYLTNVKGIASDFIVADARYFQPSTGFTSEWNVPDDAIAVLWEQGSITDGGRTYGCDSAVLEFISEEDYRTSHNIYSESAIQKQLDGLERENGKVPNNIQLYGMDSFCLNKVHVIEGDLTKLMENPDGHYIAAAAYSDDYGNLVKNSYRAAPGDMVNIRYIDEVEIYNTQTGEIYPDVESIPNSALSNVDVRILSYRDMEYEVAVLVTIPSSLDYRYLGPYFSYILDSETFMKDTGTNAVMYYTFDTEENTAETMEDYIANLTDTTMPQLDYESKKTYTDAFYSFTRMYLICGSALSFIVGLVGILNFLNAVLTSIMTRQREFALLQSVGMSGRQLKTMLITEGILLSLSAVIVSLISTIATIPLVSSALGNTFPFFVYHFTLLPLFVVIPAFILLGTLLPLITHRLTLSKSIVERLREA